MGKKTKTEEQTNHLQPSPFMQWNEPPGKITMTNQSVAQVKMCVSPETLRPKLAYRGTRETFARNSLPLTQGVMRKIT
jgi:hypothetical protein